MPLEPRTGGPADSLSRSADSFTSLRSEKVISNQSNGADLESASCQSHKGTMHEQSQRAAFSPVPCAQELGNKFRCCSACRLKMCVRLASCARAVLSVRKTLCPPAKKSCGTRLPARKELLPGRAKCAGACSWRRRLKLIFVLDSRGCLADRSCAQRILPVSGSRDSDRSAA